MTEETLVIDLEDSEVLKLALMAHDRDITLNQMITLLLFQQIEELFRTDVKTAALVSLAESGVPTDWQECLLTGSDKLGIKPGALDRMVETVRRETIKIEKLRPQTTRDSG